MYGETGMNGVCVCVVCGRRVCMWENLEFKEFYFISKTKFMWNAHTWGSGFIILYIFFSPFQPSSNAQHFSIWWMHCGDVAWLSLDFQCAVQVYVKSLNCPYLHLYWIRIRKTAPHTRMLKQVVLHLVRYQNQW